MSNHWYIVVFPNDLLLQDLGHHHQASITLDTVQNPLRGYSELFPLQLLFALVEHLLQLLIRLLGFFDVLQLLRRQLSTGCLDCHHSCWVLVSSSLSRIVDVLVLCPVWSALA